MALALKIHIVEQNVTKMMQFDPSTMVFDACRIIREKITEANLGQGNPTRWIVSGNNVIFDTSWVVVCPDKLHTNFQLVCSWANNLFDLLVSNVFIFMYICAKSQNCFDSHCS